MAGSKISNFPVIQPWIKQFRIIDMPIARQLVDELSYYKTSQVFGELKSEVEKKIDGYSKVVVLPIRELINKEECYYSADNEKETPLVQSSESPLGSESFASNLIAQLSRESKKVILEHDKSPSLYMIKHRKVRALILVDDLVGSGKRVCDFLDSIIKNDEVRTLITNNEIDLHVITFMATDFGKDEVNNWRKDVGVNLVVIHKCPTFHDLKSSDTYLKLCWDYSDQKEKYPLGFKKSAVRVVFEHSAPNKLPSVFYKDVKSFKPKNNHILGLESSWKAIFSNRVVNEQFKYQISNVEYQNKKTNLRIVQELLKRLSFDDCSSVESLMNSTGFSASELKNAINVCEKLNMLRVENKKVSITNTGRSELNSLGLPKRVVVFNDEKYYPNVVG